MICSVIFSYITELFKTLTDTYSKWAFFSFWLSLAIRLNPRYIQMVCLQRSEILQILEAGLCGTCL